MQNIEHLLNFGKTDEKVEAHKLKIYDFNTNSFRLCQKIDDLPYDLGVYELLDSSEKIITCSDSYRFGENKEKILEEVKWRGYSLEQKTDLSDEQIISFLETKQKYQKNIGKIVVYNGKKVKVSHLKSDIIPGVLCLTADNFFAYVYIESQKITEILENTKEKKTSKLSYNLEEEKKLCDIFIIGSYSIIDTRKFYDKLVIETEEITPDKFSLFLDRLKTDPKECSKLNLVYMWLTLNPMDGAFVMETLEKKSDDIFTFEKKYPYDAVFDIKVQDYTYAYIVLPRFYGLEPHPTEKDIQIDYKDFTLKNPLFLNKQNIEHQPYLKTDAKIVEAKLLFLRPECWDVFIRLSPEFATSWIPEKNMVIFNGNAFMPSFIKKINALLFLQEHTIISEGKSDEEKDLLEKQILHKKFCADFGKNYSLPEYDFFTDFREVYKKLWIDKKFTGEKIRQMNSMETFDDISLTLIWEQMNEGNDAIFLEKIITLDGKNHDLNFMHHFTGFFDMKVSEATYAKLIGKKFYGHGNKSTEFILNFEDVDNSLILPYFTEQNPFFHQRLFSNPFRLETDGKTLDIKLLYVHRDVLDKITDFCRGLLPSWINISDNEFVIIPTLYKNFLINTGNLAEYTKKVTIRDNLEYYKTF